MLRLLKKLSPSVISFLLWIIVFIGLSLLLLFFVISDSSSKFRAVTVFIYFFFVPGFAWLRCLRLDSLVPLLALIIPVSLAINVMIAQFALYTRFYRTLDTLTFLIVVSTCGVLTELLIRLDKTIVKVR